MADDSPRGHREPGWYSDPEGKAQHLAYWDGERWTGETALQKRKNPWTRWWMWLIYLVGGFFAVIVIALVAVSILGDPYVLLEEDFTDVEGLPFSLDSDRFVEMEVDDGRYVISIDDPNSPHLIRSVFDTSTESLAFESTVEATFEPEQPILTSIGCWNADSGYLFVLLPSGEAVLLEVVSEKNGERIPLSDFVKIEGFESGLPVRLEIDCVGGGTEPTIVSSWVGDVAVLSVAIDNGIDSFNAVGFWLGGEGVVFHIDDVLVTEGDTDVPIEPAPRIIAP